MTERKPAARWRIHKFAGTWWIDRRSFRLYGREMVEVWSEIRTFNSGAEALAAFNRGGRA